MNEINTRLSDIITAKNKSGVLFVDPGVASASTLFSGIRSFLDVVQLPAAGDPISAIALHMAGRRDVTSLHILSHGAPGSLSLSGNIIDTASLAARPALMAAIRDALSADAEIVLYGCSVAAGERGAAFVDALSALLDRPVAASAGLVGAAELGGAWNIPARGSLAFDAAARAAYPATLSKATFGVVTTINTTTTLTSSESGVTFSVVRSDGTPMAGVSSGFLDSGVIANTVSYTLTFSSAITITQFQIGEFTNNSESANYVFTPNTGTAVTLADDSGSIVGAIATLSPTDWTGITSMTVSYAGAGNWRVGLDNVVFTAAATAATTTAGGFKTTDGTNLTPTLTFGTGNETLTIADASHITGTSVADGGAGTDTLVLATGSDLSTAGFTLSNFENLTLATGGTAQMTAAQLNGFTGTITAAGTETVTLTSTGSITSASIGAIETVATASDTAAQTITLTAAQAAGKTLTAGDTSLDKFSVTGSAGSQSITGSAGSDTIEGGDDDDTISGGSGNDVISGGDGIDLLVGGAGNDTFTSSAANFNSDTISDFSVGDSIIVTGSDFSSLNGTAAAGSINLSGSVATTLTGITSASGTFSAVFTGGNTTITLVAPVVDNSGGGGGGGGSGGDTGTIVVTQTTPAVTATNTSQTLTNTGTTSGSAAIVQNSGNNSNLVTATLPASVSISSEGPATAQSGDTAVTTLITAIQVRGSTGQTELVSNAQTYLNTLASTTTVDIRTIVPTLSVGVTTNDSIVITGSTGASQSEAFVIDMRSITGKTLQLDNIEFASIIGAARVDGGAGNNYVTGDDQSQFISLGVGDDTLYGGGGSDTIASGAGLDRLYGDAGNDTVSGGADSDTLFGGTDQDVVYGNQASDVIYGNQGLDTLFGGQDNDTVFGGQHQDIAYGNLGDDAVYGNFGEDVLYGGRGNDGLFGGQDNDTLIGGLGDDTLNGGKGNDLISGGDGSDVVVIQGSGGADTVSDFSGAAGDRIQIAANLNGTSIDTFAELQAAAGNVDGNVVFTLGSGNTLTLMGVNSSELQSGWFTFV